MLFVLLLDKISPANIISKIKNVHADENHCQPEESSHVIADTKDSKCFKTKISELNLLGEDLKSEMDTCEYTFPDTDNEFRVDRLDL